MPWFIVQSERKTWTKYLVEAENEDEALHSSDEWQYFGYVDGDNTESIVIGGPSGTKALALNEVAGYTDD